jgi:hypothetical protein
MCFSLAFGTAPETPPQAGLETEEIRFLPELSLTSPAPHYRGAERGMYSETLTFNEMTWDATIFYGDVGESRHLNILADVLLGDTLSCIVLGVQ